MEIAWRSRRRSATRVVPTKVGRYRSNVFRNAASLTTRMHRPADLERTATPFGGPA